MPSILLMPSRHISRRALQGNLLGSACPQRCDQRGGARHAPISDVRRVASIRHCTATPTPVPIGSRSVNHMCGRWVSFLSAWSGLLDSTTRNSRVDDFKMVGHQIFLWEGSCCGKGYTFNRSRRSMTKVQSSWVVVHWSRLSSCQMVHWPPP